MMKKLLLLILAFALCFSLLTGCAGTDDGKGSSAGTEAAAESSGEDAKDSDDDDPDANDDPDTDPGKDNDEGKTKGGDPIESINGKDDESKEKGTDPDNASKEEQGSGSEGGSEGSQAADEPERITKESLPDLTIPPESLRPDDDFTGLFSNGEYNALITKNDGDEMAVAIVSAKPDKTGCEWTMSGYFSDENYRIRYSNAVKTVITYGKDGSEASRVTEYENGSGVIQFSDTGAFTWINNMEPIEKNEFIKAE